MKNIGYLATFVFVVTLLVAPSCGSGEAETYALEHARKMGPGYVTLGCVGTDSDDDGYVSCTIKGPEGEMIGVQCATGIASCASGCKMDSAKGYRGERRRF
jgi:hypothetical protein